MRRIRYKILKEKRLVIRYCEGRIDINDLYHIVKENISDHNFDPTFNVLNDLRDGSIDVDPVRISELVRSIDKNRRFISNRKVVYLTNSPNQLVISKLKDIFKGSNLIKLIIASTLTSAVRHLNMNMTDTEFIKNELSELKKTE